MTRRRRVFEVRYERSLSAWVVKRRSGRKVGPSFATKDAAVRAGARRAKFLGLICRTQLVVFNKDGTITFERTYPRSSDPDGTPS